MYNICIIYIYINVYVNINICMLLNIFLTPAENYNLIPFNETGNAFDIINTCK